MRVCIWVALIILLTAEFARSQPPVPVEQEPHHHVVLKNNFVEVIHVVLPAGESTLLHTHSRDRVAVDLTSTMLSTSETNRPNSAFPGTSQPEPTPIPSIHTDSVMLERKHTKSSTLSFSNGRNTPLRKLLQP